MMKYFFMLFVMFLFMWVNNIMCFIYNFMFFFSWMFLMLKTWNYGMGGAMGVSLSVDYFSFNLVLMSSWIIGLMLMLVSKDFEKHLFLGIMVVLWLFFLSKNLMLFYLYFELSLIPVFFIIVYLGYNLERMSAAYYMLMYTLMISLPLFVYIVKVFKIIGSVDFFVVMMENICVSAWEYFIMMGAFFVKMPMYLFHIWLPKAHVEAPVYGSMILASVLLKLGSYGLLRMLVMFLDSSAEFMSIYMSIGLVGSIIVGVLCLVQLDMKSLVAYSSVVHMNMMLCGLMSLVKLGQLSSYIIMISHGICSSGLFYMVNLFYVRSSSRLLMLNKGFVSLLMSFMGMWFMICVLNFSFPVSIGFFGEILLIGVLLSVDNFLLMFLVLVGGLSSAYSLYLYLYVSHGELMVMGKFNSGSMKEGLVGVYHIIPLVMFILNMSIF